MANVSEARLGMDISDYERKLTKATNELNKFVRGGTGSIGNLGNAVAALSGRPAGALTGLVGSLGSLAASFGLTASAAVAFGDSVQTAMGFEKSMSQLKALTGLGEREMGALKQYAIDLGATTTQSASQVVDAFRLIGSAKPELLGSADALASVTKDAITLAEAAGIEVPQAAAALTTSLNQMGKGAESAERFVNVLAAGSQKGAGDIEWLNSAITQSGTAAKAVGTEYEELVANLEQLAQGGFDASSAGTALRSIIMNLEKQANGQLKPSVVGLTTAFKNLGKECKSVSDYQEIAGKQFASQAMILAENAEKADEMRKAITGTSTASDMAKTATDNFAGSVNSLKSAWEGLMLTINSSNGWLRGWVDNTTKLVNNMRYLLANREQQVTMGANAMLNGHNGQQGLKDYLSGRMEATLNEGWSQETVIARAMKDLDQWFYVKRAENRNDKKMVDTITEAYEKAQEYVKGYFEQTEKATQATNALNAAIDGGNGDTKTPKKTQKVYDEGSIGYYQQKLKEANEKVLEATDAEAREAARRMVDTYKREIERLEGNGMTSQPSMAVARTDVSNITGLSQAAANIDTTGVKAAVEATNAAREELRVLQELDAFQKDMAQESVMQLAGAFQSLGEAIGGTAGNIVSLVGTMAAQVAQGVATIASLHLQAAAYAVEAQKAGQAAAAKAMEAHSWIPFVGIAMGVGMVASMIAAIKSVPEFAEGAYADRPTLGIFGEKGPELVVPEKKLDEAFERNADKMGIGGRVRFEIDGRKLVGVLEAENNRNNWRP